ncbi:hypothetical protein EJ110_NYTH07483 [Nymphaea thermarum]|nr:hypothetical protein EJ110_NYTH07483 [Nymphaea thermarum]
MGSSWKRNVGSVRSFISNSMGGLKGSSNLASWVVAFTLAYYLWVKPERDLKKEQESQEIDSLHLPSLRCRRGFLRRHCLAFLRRRRQGFLRLLRQTFQLCRFPVLSAFPPPWVALVPAAVA